MKKFIAVIVSIFLLFTSVCAESFDLSTMTDVDLLNLFNEVKQMLIKRGVYEGEIIYPGKYIVGETIKPGTYTLTCVSENDNGAWFIVDTISDSIDKTNVATKYMDIGDVVMIHLIDGYSLELNNCECVIETSAPSFAP